jgi:hypothetical protein
MTSVGHSSGDRNKKSLALNRKEWKKHLRKPKSPHRAVEP